MKPPDLIVINGNIVAMDALFPRVHALAARGGPVWALGSNEVIRALTNCSTRVIDREIVTCDVCAIGATEVLLMPLAGRAVHRAGVFG